jgi:hypothetical protein
MKMNSKKLFKFGIGGTIIIGTLLPVLIFAEAETKNGDQSLVAKFCERISTFSQTIDQRISSHDLKLEEKRTDILNKIADARKERDTKFNETIQKWDKNRDEHFAKMLGKAVNDQQKQAILAFKETVQTAILNRRTAIRAAIETFRDGVSATVLTRKTAVNGADTTYKNALQTALTKAQDDCKNGVSPATVRTNLKNDIQAAKDKFITDRQSIEKTETDMQSLIDSKKAAIAKANADFQAAMDKANADFKTAMGQENEEKTAAEKSCTDAGGTVKTSSCCLSATDFPNLCVIGACGCSAENSHEIKTCDCGEGKCFNGTSCVAVQ